jgi:hypothetical protein
MKIYFLVFIASSLLSRSLYSQYTSGSGDGVAKSTIPISSLSGEFFWVGNTDTDWSKASNWKPNTAVPGPNNPIIIEVNGNGNHPVLDQERSAYSLNFNGANKMVELGNYDLTITAEITGANAASYFKTNGTGSLKHLSIADNETFTFPVGNSSYNPVTITNNTGTADDFSARVADGVFINGFTGSLDTASRVNRTWHIGKTNPTANAGAGVTMSFSWDPTEEIGTMSAYRLNHHNGSGWVFATGYGGSEQVSGSNPKTLTFTGYKGGFSPFAIGGSPVSPLPIVLQEFMAQCADEQVMVIWITESEINNERFFVQRSADLIQWEQVLTIPGAGNSNAPLSYSATDDRPLGGVSYYRLGQQDYDGTTEVFDPVSVVCHATDESGHALHVYPNPAEDAFTLVLFLSQAISEAMLELTDLNGQVVAVRTISAVKGNNAFLFQREGLGSGVYFLRLRSEKQAFNPLKVVLR